MPNKKDPLSAEQITLLRAWIDQGADWPEIVAGAAKDPRKHWAFIPPIRPKAPAALAAMVAFESDSSGVNNGTDAGSARQPRESITPALSKPEVLGSASRRAAAV